MPRLAIANMTLGFLILTLTAASGAFLANNMADAFIYDKELLSTWSQIILNSAHGHTNLFGILHIAFGLTLPYSKLSQKVLVLQTIGLGFGALAMGPVMIVRSTIIPTADGIDFIGFVMGALLSCSLFALASHCFGLGLKLKRV